MIIDEYYTIKIKSDKYIGDFYRQLAAHLTGIIGDNDNSSASRYINDEVAEEFEDVMRIVVNQKGWLCPARPSGTKEMDLVFEEKPTKKQTAIIINRLPSFLETYKEIDVDKQYAKYLTFNLSYGGVFKMEVRQNALD